LSGLSQAEGFAGLEADRLVQALIIRYDKGAGIGWHRHRPVFSTMRFRRRKPGGFDRVSVLLMLRLFATSGT